MSADTIRLELPLLGVAGGYYTGAVHVSISGAGDPDHALGAVDWTIDPPRVDDDAVHLTSTEDRCRPLTLGLPTLPVYLSAHESVRHGARVRAVWDHLSAGLRTIIASAARVPRKAQPKAERKPRRTRPLPRKRT